MTPLEIYTYFVLPGLLLAIGVGTVWLTRRDQRQTPAEQKGPKACAERRFAGYLGVSRTPLGLSFRSGQGFNRRNAACGRLPPSRTHIDHTLVMLQRVSKLLRCKVIGR